MAKQTEETTPAEPTMASVMDKLAWIALENNKVQREQLRQTRRPSNTFGTLASPFNPRGEKDYPMATLKCEMWAPHKMTDAHMGGLDREEVDLLNLLEPCEAVIEMNDGEMQQVCVVGHKDTISGELYKLALMGPRDETGEYTGLFSKDRYHRFPSLKSILRQILGDKADAVMTMKEEKRRIKLPDTDPQHLAISIGE